MVSVCLVAQTDVPVTLVVGEKWYIMSFGGKNEAEKGNRQCSEV